VRPPRLEGGKRTVPRLCINVCPGICLTTEKNHGKPQSGHPKNARLISARQDSFSRLGHRQAMASICLLNPVAPGLHLERRGQPSARLSICRVAGLRSSPNHVPLSRALSHGSDEVGE